MNATQKCPRYLSSQPKLALLRWFCQSTVAFYLACSSSLLVAKDGYVPYIESLETAQKRAYIKAAPRGEDALESDGSALVVNATIAETPEEESTLELRALEQSGALTLEETQQDQALTDELEQYGYAIFNATPIVENPTAGMPVPTGYRLGPGDNIIVQLFGKRNVEYQLVVTRDGEILVPEYGPVSVNGFTFDELEQVLTDGFERRVIGAKVVVTMGKLRSIQVRLSGDVVQPGIYTVSGLSTFVDALLTTGGVERTGSLRQIQLIRNGRRIATLDLYDLLQRGLSKGDHFLEHNDTLFVPPIGNIVYVGGEVQRPAIYELRDEKTVADVISMAGGLLPTASLEHSIIERIQRSGTRTLLDFSKNSNSTTTPILTAAVRNGDFLRILPLEDQLEDVVVVSGHVKRPGAFQFRTGMRISDVINNAEALLPGADVDFLLVKREQPSTLRTEVVFASVIEVLESANSAANILLQPRDELIVFDLGKNRAKTVAKLVNELKVQATNYRPARLVKISGAVRFSGELPLQENAKLLDVLSLAGGTRTGTDLNYGIIARTLYPSRDIEILQFSLAAALANPGTEKNVTIAPGDRIYFFDTDRSREQLISKELDALRAQTGYGEEERLVSILGQVRHSGVYPLLENMRASDLLCAANGLQQKAYALGAQLSRVNHITESDNHVEHMKLNSEVLLEICKLSALALAGNASSHQLAELNRNYHDSAINPGLEAMDQLTFSEKSGWVERATVTLSGEVTYPGVYAIDRDETICSVLKRAGGVTEDAYVFGSKFTRRSVKELQQQTVDELQAQLDDLMIELSLSHSFNNDDKTSDEWAGKQDYLKTIRQIERAEATGRMVINLEKAQDCHKRYNIVMQNGDALYVPNTPGFVQVAGQVYVPTSHLYSEDRKIIDYVELSGGHTVLGRMRDTYVIQANGEVLNFKGSRSSKKIARAKVMPGARIYVPINVDRMNGTEKAQTWVSSLIQSAILAGLVL